MGERRKVNGLAMMKTAVVIEFIHQTNVLSQFYDQLNSILMNLTSTHTSPLEGEKVKTKHLEITPEDKEETKSKTIDLLGKGFEQTVDHPKCVHIESAAIKWLCTREGVLSNKPSERGQLPKGVQPGFITEVTDENEVATLAAMAISEMDEVEPSYEEAHMRFDWPVLGDTPSCTYPFIYPVLPSFRFDYIYICYCLATTLL